MMHRQLGCEGFAVVGNEEVLVLEEARSFLHRSLRMAP
jgi:hypothetical protein